MELFVLSPTPTCSHTHTHTHTHTRSHTYKHNNVCLYGFSREQRHFQAEIIFSPAEYLPRTLVCVCVCVCVFEWEREREQSCVCVRYYFLRSSSPQDIKKRKKKKKKKNCWPTFWTVEQDVLFLWSLTSGLGPRIRKCKHPNEEAKSYLNYFFFY